jgi:hypothetical protein
MIMVLIFTGSLSVADVRVMLIGALGCNSAWAIIDAILHLMGRLAERSRDLATSWGVKSTVAQAVRVVCGVPTRDRFSFGSRIHRQHQLAVRDTAAMIESEPVVRGPRTGSNRIRMRLNGGKKRRNNEPTLPGWESSLGANGADPDFEIQPGSSRQSPPVKLDRKHVSSNVGADYVAAVAISKSC